MYVQLRIVICILAMAFLSCNVTVYDELFDPALMKVTYNGNGSTGGDVPVDQTIYEKGQEVIVLGNMGALVRTGYTYMDWNTAPDGSGIAYSDGDTFLIETFGLVLYAQWTINQYTLSYAAGANGSLSGASPQTVNHGSDGTAVTAVPDTGYHFVQWGDGVMTATRTDTNVSGDITATAAFGINQYTLTYSAGANGSISGTALQTVNYGSNGTAVTAVPGTGYHFVQWSDGVMTATRTDTNVTASMSATASFGINQYTLTYLAGANGSVSGTMLQTVNHGSDGTAVTAVPSTGYHFVQWDDGVMTASRTDTNVTGDITVTAAFALNQCILTYSAGANGSISGTALQTVNYGSNGTTVRAIPGSGYHFVQWSDGVMTDTRTDTNVTGDVTVTATFAPVIYTISYNLIGGTNDPGNPGSYTIEDTPITFLPATRADYIFAGWYADPGFTMQAVEIPSGSAGDVMLYARWIPCKMVPAPAVIFPTGTDDLGTDSVGDTFLIAETEVTYELWSKVYQWATTDAGGGVRADGGELYYIANAGRQGGDLFSGPVGTDQHPVTTVSWRDSIVWCNALTEYYNECNGTTLECVYYTDSNYNIPLRTSTNSTIITGGIPGSQDMPYIMGPSNGNTDMVNCTAKGFRLPTSMEWELAARYRGADITNSIFLGGIYWTKGNSASGATAAYSNVPATGAAGWYDQNSGNTTHAVKGRNPNALGLYDMSGNIWESCFDWYTINSDHVRRGGGWYHADVWMQIGAMHFGFPYHADCFVGFRTARTQ